MAHTKVQIADLRPTQLTLGLLEVKERAVKLEKQSSANRKSYLEKKAIPYVLGPGKHIYIVDHHHLARALWSIDIREALLGEKVADWSELAERPFWRKMEKNGDRKSTRLNSSHQIISYAVFCLKKKKHDKQNH